MGMISNRAVQISGMCNILLGVSRKTPRKKRKKEDL